MVRDDGRPERTGRSQAARLVAGRSTLGMTRPGGQDRGLFVKLLIRQFPHLLRGQKQRRHP